MIKLLLLAALVVAGVYGVTKVMDMGAATKSTTDANDASDTLLEEKYGFTGNQALP